MLTCQYCGRKCKNNNSLRNHERLCKENPNQQILKNNIIEYNRKRKELGIKGENQYTKAKRLGLPKPIMSDAARKKISNFASNRKLTDETKKKISESMKIAHKEGRAHNIGECRHNCKPSYPEQWFMKVIESEFLNKKYIREYPFHKYSLDFAWPELKICIEIDGEQHQMFEEYKKRDLEKDELLKDEGWKELRIPWKECFHNPRYYIDMAKKLFE